MDGLIYMGRPRTIIINDDGTVTKNAGGGRLYRLPVDVYRRRVEHSNNKLKTGRDKLKRSIMRNRGGVFCRLCGISALPLCCYDFHHINKKTEVPSILFSNAAFGGVEHIRKLNEEMNNCEVVCRNCHTTIHRFGWDKAKRIMCRRRSWKKLKTQKDEKQQLIDPIR